MVPSFIMTALDSNVTQIALGSRTTQIAQGSKVTDKSGTRSATVIFPSNTQATLVFADGTSRAVNSLSVRATEVTAGESGPKGMPAPLPPESAYTYAVEFSADEAIDAGAVKVQFNKPVYHYVENFLNFPVGTPVPVGYYNRQVGQWQALDNGRVIKILSISKGSASVDVNGNGVVATATELASLGITAEELKQLATLYSVGQTLWRSPVPHFSLLDDNFPYDPNNPEIAELSKPFTPEPPNNSCPSYIGSKINAASQVLGETVPLAGTDFSLNYSSGHIPDRKIGYTIRVPLTGDNVTDIIGVQLYIQVAGQYFSGAFYPNQNTFYDYVWDGKDAYGRPVNGAVNAYVEVIYQIQEGYGWPAANPQAFGLPSTHGFLNPIPGRWVQEGHRYSTVSVGVWDARKVGLGGWTMSINHAYDPVSHKVYFGDGHESQSLPLGNTVSVFAGSGEAGNSGDGGQAINASFQNINGIARAADGSVFVASGDIIRKISPDGTISRYAGGGGSMAEGLPATSTAISFLRQLAINPVNGALVYVDAGAGMIRSISTTGIVTTLASGIDQLYSIAISNNGVLYFTRDSVPGVTRLAPSGAMYYDYSTSIVGTSARVLYSPINDFLYIAGGGHLLVQRASYNQGDLYYLDHAGDANQLAQDPNGDIIFADYNGNFYRISGGQSNPIPLPQSLQGGQFIALPDGSMLVGMMGEHKIYKITPKYPGFTGYSFMVGSEDGKQLYFFDKWGTHLLTADAQTGAPIYQFSYNWQGYLASVNIPNVGAVYFNRNGSGSLSAVSPFGVTNSLAYDANGMLAGVTDPIGRTYGMNYSGASMSLLSRFTQPNGGNSYLTYDDNGELLGDADALGALQSLTRTEIDPISSSYSIKHSSPMGVDETHEFSFGGLGQQIISRSPGSAPTTSITDLSGKVTTYSPDGTQYSYIPAPDPILGFQYPFAASNTIKTPSGLTQQIKTNVTASLGTASLGSTVQPIDRTVSVSINGGAPSVDVYDSASRTVTHTTAEGRVSKEVLETDGKLSQIQVQGLLPITVGYGDSRHIVNVSQGDRTIQFTYDSHGYLASQKVASQNPTYYSRDAAGQVQSITLPDGRVVQFSYDSLGNVTSVTPPGRSSYTFGFDLLGQALFDTVPADGNQQADVTQYSYNADHKITKAVRPDGSVISYSYDTAGRLSGMSLPDGSFQYSYDPNSGKMIQASSPNAQGSEAIQLSYDGFLNTKLSWQGPSFGSIQKQYDNFFDYAYMFLLPGAAQSYRFYIPYVHDHDGLLITSDAVTLTRDKGNGLVTSSLTAFSGDGPKALDFADQYGRNDFGELTSYHSQTKSGSQVLFDEKFTRDDLGRIISKQEINEAGVITSFAYTYDQAGRLVTVTTNGTETAHYNYDSNSNRVSKITPQGTTAGSYDGKERILNYGNLSFTYTLNGEIATKKDSTSGQQTQMSYDALGNLKQVTFSDGNLIQYEMDGLFHRLSRVATKGALPGTFRYFTNTDGTIYAASYQGDAAHPGTKFYQFAYASSMTTPSVVYIVSTDTTGKVIDGNVYKVVMDERGSVRQLIDEEGNIAQLMDYDEFGNVTRDTNPGFQPFGFAGGLYDPDTKLVHFGAREYDPSIGRWLSRDPIGFKGGDTNLYGYVMNDPVNFVDPTGTRLSDIVKAIGIGYGVIKAAEKGLMDWVTQQYVEKLEDVKNEAIPHTPQGELEEAQLKILIGLQQTQAIAQCSASNITGISTNPFIPSSDFSEWSK